MSPNFLICRAVIVHYALPLEGFWTNPSLVMGWTTITGLDWCTGLVDWTGGLDQWTGLVDWFKNHNENSPIATLLHRL